MSLHNRNMVQVPKNIFSIYDLDDWDDGWNDWDEWDDEWFDISEVFVITPKGVFVTDSTSYYEILDINKNFDIQDVLREDYVVYGMTTEPLREEYPECFI